MFNLIIVSFFTLVSLLLAYVGMEYKIEPLVNIAIGGGVLSFVWFVSSILSNFSHYTDQVRNFENLQSQINTYSRYKKNQDKLLEEIKIYLGSQYPDIEKEIFRTINEAKGDINVILNYPEIKSSVILSELSNRIKEIYEGLHRLESQIENVSAIIRYHNQSKWEFIKPSVPSNLNGIVYTQLSM